MAGTESGFHSYGLYTHIEQPNRAYLIEYDSILKGDYEFLISRKEDVCQKFYAGHIERLLKPVTGVEYQREAYVSDFGNVRITFDKNISASAA